MRDDFLAGVLLSHPTGNQNVREAVRAFSQTERLHAFVTALHVSVERFPWKNLPESLRDEMRRRDFSETGATVVSAVPTREMVRIVAGKCRIQGLTRHETGWASVDQIYRAVDACVARLVRQSASVRAVYAYEDGALETFRAAKALGLRCIYELPIGYWREHHRLNTLEAACNPGWAQTWSAIEDSPEKLARKDEEISLADVIVVASSYTRDTLKAYPGNHAPTVVVPYGFPAVPRLQKRSWFDGEGPLRLLYVGGLSQRKGLSYMVEAIAQFGERVSLTVIGTGIGLARLKQQVPAIRYLGSLPHSAVLEQMRLHDVLLFPSLFEGFGMVITEAMSQGMVVMATDRTALPDIADSGEAINIPVASAGAIAEALERLLTTPSLVGDIGKAARSRALTYGWSSYRKRLMEVV